jgi:hypothetical protein
MLGSMVVGEGPRLHGARLCSLHIDGVRRAFTTSEDAIDRVQQRRGVVLSGLAGARCLCTHRPPNARHCTAASCWIPARAPPLS